MASGKPVIVQHTGPSEFLPDAQGMFRFRTMDDAVAAIDVINSEYRAQCEAARELAETCFDARKELTVLLNTAL